MDVFPYRHLIKTITTDNGSEFCDHRTISKALGATIYFADPFSSWQKGSIENANKLIRQYIPKSVNFETFTDEQILKIQYKINRRPRKNCISMTQKLVSFNIFNYLCTCYLNLYLTKKCLEICIFQLFVVTLR